MEAASRIRQKMARRWILIAVVLMSYDITASAQGPVYDPQNNIPGAVVASSQPESNGNFLTQTVYGFLDFTTTIGNTVMVFSPQSAPPPEPPTTKKTVVEPVIEEKPPQKTSEKAIAQSIQPSKTTGKEGSSQIDSKSKIKSLSSEVNVVKQDDNISKEKSKPLQSKVSVVSSTVKEQKQIISKVDVVVGPSKIVEAPPVIAISSKVEVKQASNPKPVNKNKIPVPEVPVILSSRVEVHSNVPQSSIVTQPILSSVVEIVSSQKDDDEPAILISNNNIGEPEYDFLSRQPSEVVEETYKVINIRPSKALHKPKHAHKHRPHSPVHAPKQENDEERPLGLVTTLGGTIVKDGLTTIHETSVIGTYISGKYAQVLHSASHVVQPPNQKKIVPSPTLRILKTAAPAIGKSYRHHLDPTPAASINEETSLPYENSFGKTSRRQSGHGSGFKNRFRGHNTEEEVDNQNNNSQSNKKNKNRNQSGQRSYSNRFGRASNTPELATVSVFSEPAPAYNNRRQNKRNGSFKSTSTVVSSVESHTRRGFKPRLQPSSVEPVAASTSLYKFKLNRTPGRWQYKTTPKPRVTIRKMNGEEDLQTTPITPATQDDLSLNDVTPQARSDTDLELSGSQNGGALLDENAEDNTVDKSPPVETIKVEISTPADFKDIYYEIATIKSPYTFQVGGLKNTRFITVTSTFEKSIEPTYVPNAQNSPTEPLTENILASAPHYDKENILLDSSIATLPPIHLSSDMETPPLETITDTFSTTQHMLKTHVLPVIYNGTSTTIYTLVQTYHITRLVTATKTLPPMEIYQFVPSKTLKEFNSRLDEAGSELHLELQFGDDNEGDEDNLNSRVFPPELDLANIGSDFDLSEVDRSRFPDNHLRLKKAHSSNGPKVQQITEPPPPTTPALTPEQAQQLALLRFLNPAAAAQIPNVITTSKPVIKFETIYESHVIPVFDGKNTIQSTLSRPIATVTKTEYEIGTSTLTPLPGPPINQLYPQQPFQLTSTPVVQQTEITATDSKVLKLTFGAKTAFTTLFSTRIIPTVVTTYVTQSVPIQPSAAYPGYFPAAFPPFPYVG